ncbi:MAG: GNAT family N-acetyltransferase [Myxococcota bacterium]|jgi:hypothetical protein|nr:GNAT family N-acetyltransferase [Myxococcota bacterium]
MRHRPAPDPRRPAVPLTQTPLASTPLSSTPRTALRRHPERANLDRAALHALLDDCLVVHVAVPSPEGEAPTLLPMAFGRIGDRLYLHGAIANALLRGGTSREVCVCATKVDGLVLAKSAFHHSMNFRAAVIFGSLVRIEGDEAARALDAIVDHALPGRSAECRAPTEAERRATLVVALDLAEASVKVREGGPRDAEADLALPHWAGVLPLDERMGAPSSELADEVPASVIAAALRRAPRLEGAVIPEGVGEVGGSFELSGDPRRLDVPRVLGWLRATYWAEDLDLARLLRSIQGAYVVGAYDANGSQVGFARAVTDGETFGWLADVYVDEAARGRGLSRALTRFLVEHPRFSRLRRWMLGTRDAHAVYAPLGFEPPPEGRFLVRPRR